MDAPMFPGYYAQETGGLRVGSQPGSPCVRATADDFYQFQLTRGAGHEPGGLGHVPHRGYLTAPHGP
eukprot:8628490-Pyramimonas_sp.AAC.1